MKNSYDNDDNDEGLMILHNTFLVQKHLFNLFRFLLTVALFDLLVLYLLHSLSLLFLRHHLLSSIFKKHRRDVPRIERLSLA